MTKTFRLKGTLVPSQGRKSTSQSGGMPGGGAVAIGTPQESASTVINNINNVTNVIGGDYSKITRIAIADLLLLDKTQVGEKDLYIVYASGSDAEGWSEEDFEFDGNTYPAESFFQLINGEWQPITDEIDLSKSPKFGNLPEEVYMVEGLFPPTYFPNIYGRDKAGLRIAKVRRYRLDDAGVYQPVKESTGTPGGGTSVNDMWTINVPYARSYLQGGTTHYEGGLLTAEDYRRLKENNGVEIDTEVPEQPSDTHVPSTKLVVDNFKVLNLWLNSLSDTKVDETELSKYFDKNYILANYYDKSLLDEALGRVQYKNTLEENVAALGFTKNAGTITGVVFNGSTLGNSGVVRISAMPLGYFYTSSNNGVVQTGKWREIAYANVNVSVVTSIVQNFSISRTVGIYGKECGIVSVSFRASYGTVSHMSLVTDNNAIVPHVSLKYESGRLSIYVTSDEAWESWRLTAIHYPQYFAPGNDTIVDAPVAPAGGMLVSAVSYVPDVYDQTHLDAVDYVTAANRTKVITVNALAFWDGSYNGQNHASNLAYCRYGVFGTIVTKSSDSYAVSQVLSINADLNAIVTPGLYYIGGGNSCTNRPASTSGNAFGLQVVHTASGAYYTQIYYDYYGSVYKRFCRNGAWGEWVNYSIPGAQADWSETDSTSPAFVRNKPVAVTEETVFSWGFVKRKFIRRTVTYNAGTYGGEVIDSRGVAQCGVLNGRYLNVVISGISTQQEYQDFLLKHTVSVSYTYFEGGVATRAEGVVDTMSATSSSIYIRLKQDMLRPEDALVYISVVFDQII